MNLGQLLRKKRKQKSLTQSEVGKIIGVSTNTISKYERNIIDNMGREKIIALSKLLDIPTIVFIEAVGNEDRRFEQITPKEFTDEVKNLLDKTIDLTEQQKQHLISTLELFCSDDK